MSVIRKLPDHVINQIKAGEVVERPSSVVKELLENALDAQASEVEIELIDGGRQLIRVVDNGTGMSPDDAMMALERHATSKLTSAIDLDDLATFGFRGKHCRALPLFLTSLSKHDLSRRRLQPKSRCKMASEVNHALVLCLSARKLWCGISLLPFRRAVNF